MAANYRFFLLVLGVFFILELALQTFWQGRLGVYLQPVVYVLFLLFYLVGGTRLSMTPSPNDLVSKQNSRNYVLIGAIGINLLIFAICFQKVGTLINEIAIDPLNSDVMPAIQLYVQRLLSGEWVYAPMEFPGWTVIPNYLPMVYLPFVIPEMIGVDYRWLPITFFLIYTIYYFHSLWKNESLKTTEFAIKSIVPAIILWLLVKHEPMMFAHTAELMTAVFYLILCETILSKRPWIAAAGISLCLLSRYSFGLWLPFYIFVYWNQFGFQHLLKLGLVVLLAVFVVYVYPFMFEDPLVYKKGMGYYMYSAEGEWRPHGWQDPGDRPYHLGRGFGFAVYVYDFVAGSIQDKLKTIQLLNLTTSALLAACLFGIYWNLRKHLTRKKLFMIFTLKVYIMIFYSFIHVPYIYLFVMPLLLWLPILLRVNFVKEWEAAQSSYKL